MESNNVIVLRRKLNMSKKQKLYNLRLNISVEAQRIRFLLKNIIDETAGNLEANVLSSLALEKICKIEKSSENLGKILKH